MTRLDDDVYVEFIDFKENPGRELVTINEDGSYTILVNARLSYEMQCEAINHAKSHINNNDFEKSCVQSIESEAHNKKSLPRVVESGQASPS